MAISALTCIAAREGRINGQLRARRPDSWDQGLSWCAAALGGPPPGPDHRVESLVGGRKGALRGLYIRLQLCALPLLGLQRGERPAALKLGAL